jgi:pimeloyl-ACP methyl ester carboxylesterase
MITRVAAHRLVLCAAFTSFRAAAHSWGVPRRFVAVLPHIWRAEEALRDYSAPVLIVHGEQDRLFPVQMAEDLAACCAAGAVLLVVPELSHDQPFYRPHISYWGPILSHLAPQDQDLGGQEI